MEQIDMEKFKQERGKGARLFSRSNSSSVYRLKDGSFLKIYSKTMHFLCQIAGVNLEKKITSLEKIEEVPEIIIPDTAIYYGSTFIGYTIPSAKGISMADYSRAKTGDKLLDLSLYTKEYSNLEGVIKRANQKGIVFPDLLNFENIFIKNANGEISFNLIDLDGIQFQPQEEYGCVQMATLLGNEKQYYIPKYCSQLAIFNHNLDKKSLMLAYFITVLGFNIQEVIDSMPSQDEKIKCFNAIMKDLNIPSELKNNLAIALFDTEHDNDYLGSLVDEIAEEYQLQPFPPKPIIRQFVRK